MNTDRWASRGGFLTPRDAGLNLAAAFADCAHRHVEPVTISTGETVAAICAGCLREVPRSYLLPPVVMSDIDG